MLWLPHWFRLVLVARRWFFVSKAFYDKLVSRAQIIRSGENVVGLVNRGALSMFSEVRVRDERRCSCDGRGKRLGDG